MGNATNTVIPAPFVFSPSQAWDGNDGSWSTFIIRVGTPEQDFRVLISTAGQETWVPVPEGCIASDPSNCGSLRGVYPFNGAQSSGFQYNQSSTWKLIGLYDLILENQLNYTGNGLYGLDNVGLELQNSGGLNLTGQVVAGIATKDFYLGIFGIGPKPSNFSNFQYPQPSFMHTLKDENKIPSLSYGYTAGASYRIPKLPGSLTLGGYDESRFKSSQVSFQFALDDSKTLSMGIQMITATNTLQGSINIMSAEILSFIDSTVPHIWLPQTVCDRFEQAFGLTYDPTTDLYLVNNTIHNQLLDLNPTVTFALGNTGDPANTVNIALPYGAFDLQATYPIYANLTNYFPIRRAANDTQYTLGRTFLQEAYIIADYERSNFSVNQAIFQSPMPQEQIIAISPLQTVSNTTPNNTTVHSGVHHDLAAGAIAGTSIGAIIFIILLVAFGILFFYRRRRGIQNVHAQAELGAGGEKPPVYAGGELMSEERHEMQSGPIYYEVGAGKTQGLHLMSDDARAQVHELVGDGGLRHEAPGVDVQRIEVPRIALTENTPVAADGSRNFPPLGI
ncbi:acid protease [Lepidopterella palustris CBS 459.81]|uniref:Acid protease n=1 Tax=Lepidopterella palustris CBS 459.81 TaxID=1314670 RepID=A0A8E2JIP3_9PEZI|nr:acid protease [Lepidopterella palustris CBS 459.81]